MCENVSQVRVDLAERSYNVYIGQGLLAKVGAYFIEQGLSGKVMIVTNPVIASLYGKTVCHSLTQAGLDVKLVEVPEGEQYKSLDSAKFLYDQAFQLGLDRYSSIVALGGGVIGDLAGFIAATYMRGINFIQIPTTLLALVDSSVGGKVAVNHPMGKNIIGAFYQPKMVIADLDTLNTLPVREFKAGMAEVIKYGIIWDYEFFVYLENHLDEIKNLDKKSLLHIVEQSCAIKAAVVSTDETEKGQRAILNYGHTFGHAYEALTGYKRYVHGEAVGIGMITASDVAERMGMLTSEESNRISQLIRNFGLPDSFGPLDLNEILISMGHDKKAQGGKIIFIIPKAIGKVRVMNDISNEILLAALQKQSG